MILSTGLILISYIFLHKVNKMKSQQFPLFLKETEQKTKIVDAELFISFFTNLPDLKILQNNVKAIEQNITILVKQPQSNQHVVYLGRILCGLFKHNPMEEIITFIRAVINPDVKFEAASKNVEEVLQGQDIKNAVSDQAIALPCAPTQEPIALPYQAPVYGPQPSPYIATHSQNAGADVFEQQKQGDPKVYMTADNELIDKYLQNRFKVVKRQGLSEFFVNMTQILCTELMEEFLEQNFLNLPISIIVELLKLLEYIVTPIFSFHLMDIAQAITNKLYILLQAKQTEKILSKDQYSSIVYTFNNITERFAEYAAYDGESWNFQTNKRMIILFIRSQVSQKKLFAIKVLGEICRKSVYYNYTIPSEKIKGFINDNYILDQIYRADNHPEVIAKGEEVFLYMSKDECLNKYQIDLIFNLLEKCHENLSKALFLTLQKIEEKNIENNRSYFLQKIVELPRSNCFNDQTFALIQRIILLNPPEEIEGSLQQVFVIIDKNYDKLRDSLKNQSIKLFFEIYVMGIELGVFHQNNSMAPLIGILKKPESSLYLCMIEAFILKIKDKTYHQKYGNTCRKILQQVIRNLFQKEKIHKMHFIDLDRHIKILMLLLESSDDIDDDTLNHEDLWNLIKVNNLFSQFIRHYPQTIQINMISSLIKTEEKTSHDLRCIIDLYHIINANVRQNLAPLIVQEYHKTKDIASKTLLAPQILQIQHLSFDAVLDKIDKCQENPFELISWLILSRQILSKQDEKGFGEYPPFECLHSSYEVFIKVDRYNTVLDTNQFELTVKSYNTMYEIINQILKIFDQPFDKSKIKLNEKYLELPDLKKRISFLTSSRKVAIQVYQTLEYEWFDKAQLFDQQNSFKHEITDCLKEIFFKYSTEKGKIQPQNLAEIFSIAAKQPAISPYDSRISEIINGHSHSGQYLTVDEWINFFYQSSLKNAPTVVSNLVNLGYKQIFNKSSSFEEMFQSDHELRRSLVKDGRVYNVLFRIFADVVSPCQNQELQLKTIEQLIKTLNLLPTHQQLLGDVKEHSQQIFSRESWNYLYYWYLSKLLRYAYFDTSMENHQKWKTCFLESSNAFSVKKAYIQFLEVIFSKNHDKNFNSNQIIISILQNFGGIVREALQKIPILTNINFDEVTPLTHEDIDPFIESTGIHEFSQILNKLSSMSIGIYKSQRSIAIVENAMAVVSHLILRQSKVQKIKDISILGEMIFHENKQMRILFNSFYLMLANIIPSIKEGYYSIYINKKDQSQTCKQYFNALSKMLSFEQDDKRYLELSQVLQQDISQYKFKEEGSSILQTDERLLGELKVINYIKLYNPRTVIERSTISSIQHLLEQNSSEQIRQILYNMSYSFCDFESNFNLVNKILDNLQLSRNSSVRGKVKMGMYNMGCICYINSVIQQLQMIEPFRTGIISTYVQDNSIDFFRQFQSMIYQLTFGQRVYLIPEQFCLNYLDYNGQPVNTKEQHDADEFLNQLFDRLETRLKPTNESTLINTNFKGEVVNIINCDTCFHQKERTENFYILSVQIKHLESLQQCINKYIEPEIICDFFCEFCQKKETIQKYNRLKTLPPFLFIHLQRLVFDLESMYKIKLDHPINFPHQIDLSQYFNAECSQPQIYNLKGFVVHIGSSEGGHYYSIIKVDGEWIKFDDTRIDPWRWEDGSHDKNHAYLLIYEKSVESKELVKKEMTIGNKFVMEEIRADNSNLQKQKIFLQPSFSKFLLQIFTSIDIPEEFAISPSQLSNPYHEKFLSLPENIQKQLDIAFDGYLRYLKLEFQKRQLNLNGNPFHMHDNNHESQKEITELQKISLYILTILHYRPQIALALTQEYLSDSSGNFFHLMYIHREQEVRQILKTFLFKVFMILKSQIGTNFILPVPHNHNIQKLLQKILVCLCEVGKNSYKMLDFFQLINWLLKSDNRFGQWFQCNRMGPRLIHFLMQGDSKLEGIFPNYPLFMQGNRKNSSIEMIVEILIELVKYEKDISINIEEVEVQRKAYLNFQLYRRIYQDRYAHQGLPNLLSFCAKNNEEFTRQTINFVLQNLNRFSHNDKYIFSYINILYSLLDINDNLQRERIEKMLGIPLPLKKREKEGEEYMIRKKTDRYCRYENSTEKQGDQIIMSFLELLYTNRKEQNYFVLYGITALLQLKTQNQVVSAYIQNLPGPCPVYPNYTDWITQFLYDSQKMKNEDHKDISAEEKQKILKEIARLINKFENTEEDSQEHLLQKSIHHNANNKPYIIMETPNATEWSSIYLNFGQNVILKDIVYEDDQLAEKEFIVGYERIVFGQTEENHEKCSVIQYKMCFNCKVKMFFTQGFPYTFYFEKGYFQFAVPFYANQTSFMVLQIPEGQVKRVLNHRKQQEVKKMDIQTQEKKQEVNQPLVQQQFPTIAEAYPQYDDINTAVNDAKKDVEVPGQTIECPFCGFTSSTFSSRCANCKQEWGQMNWY